MKESEWFEGIKFPSNTWHFFDERLCRCGTPSVKT